MRARALLLLALAAAACSSGPAPAPTLTPRPGGPAMVYAALGASETAGVGTRNTTRESFPQRLFQHLGPGSVLYNFGLPGETVAAALRDEVPPAIAVHPTLATVWFNVDDLAAGLAVEDHESRLDEVVGRLRRAGVTRVLVANTPHLDRLPAYSACRPDPPANAPRCPLNGVTLPPTDQVNALVEAYNGAIARVVARQGATLVDLHAAGQVPDLHPEYVSEDGFHPSAAGAAAIAATFAAALG